MHRQLTPKTPASPQNQLHPTPTPNFSDPFTEGPISHLHNNLQRPCATCWPRISSPRILGRDPAQQQHQQAARNVSAPPHPVVGNRFFSVMILILWIVGIFHQLSRKTIVREIESRTRTKPDRWRSSIDANSSLSVAERPEKTAENLWPSPPDCRNQDGKSHFILERSDFCWCRFETALSRTFGEWFRVEIKSRSFLLAQTGVNRCTNREIK